MTLVTLDQTRALLAFAHMQEIQAEASKPGKSDKQKEFRDTYGGMALKLPALIRSAGLCQALHFVRSRHKPACDLLLSHVSTQLRRMAPGIAKDDPGGESLCAFVRDADLKTYIHLSREAIATLEWYARLSQSELKVERTTDTDRTLAPE